MKLKLIWVIMLISGMLFDYGCEKDSGSNSKSEGVISANPGKVAPGDTTTLTYISTYSDADNISYLWETTDGTITGTGKTVFWIAPDDMGLYTVTCIATRENGGEENGIVSITVFSLMDTTFMVDSKSGTSSYGGIGIFNSNVKVSEGDSLIILAYGEFYNGIMMVPDPNGFPNVVAENFPAMVMGIASNCLIGSIGTSFSGSSLLDDGLDIHPLTGESGSDYDMPGLFGPGFVGSEFHAIIPSGLTGHVCLAINDFPLGDNDGDITVNLKKISFP